MLAYFTSACLVAAPAVLLADALAVEPEPAACLARQCVHLVLRCGTAAMRAQQLPRTIARLQVWEVLFDALEKSFLLARQRTVGDSRAGFMAGVPPALVVDLLRALVAALAAVPPQLQGPGVRRAVRIETAGATLCGHALQIIASCAGQLQQCNCLCYCMPAWRLRCCACAAQLDAPHCCSCTDLAGSAYAGSIQLLARALNAVFTVFSATPEALEQLLRDQALMGSLMELLIPNLATAAVALQLPAERRPPGCSWHSAACTAGVLNVLIVGTYGMLGARVAEGRGSAPRLLPAAAQLVLHAPLPAVGGGPDLPGGTSAAEAWDDLASLSELLSAAGVSQLYALHLLQQPDGSGRASADHAHERLAAQAAQLLPLLPSLVSILKAFASSAQASSNQALGAPQAHATGCLSACSCPLLPAVHLASRPAGWGTRSSGWPTHMFTSNACTAWQSCCGRRCWRQPERSRRCLLQSLGARGAARP